MRRNTPHDKHSPRAARAARKSIVPYATLWHGENGVVLLLFARLFCHTFTLSSIFFSQKYFFPPSPSLLCSSHRAYSPRRDTRASCDLPTTLIRHFAACRVKVNKKSLLFSMFFYNVSFLTKISTKNRTKWIFTNHAFRGIILKLSAAPTPQRHAQR